MFTQHAKQRMQQRAITLWDVNALLDWGEEKMEHGALIYRGTRKTVTRLISMGIAPKKAERIKGKYLVIYNGSIVTVAHLH